MSSGTGVLAEALSVPEPSLSLVSSVLDWFWFCLLLGLLRSLADTAGDDLAGVLFWVFLREERERACQSCVWPAKEQTWAAHTRASGTRSMGSERRLWLP